MHVKIIVQMLFANKTDGRLTGGAADGGRDRNPAREAKRLRDYLKDYFNNEGAVAWQDGRI